MQTLDVVKLAASKLASTGAALWQAIRPIENDTDDNEPFGEVDVFQGLGLTSFPYPADDNGHAEGVIVTNCGNMNAVCIGARDTRTAAIVGNGKGGDTILHSTGPSQAAQVQCKEEKRQVVLATKNSRDETQALVLDGKNQKFAIAFEGFIIEIDGNSKTLSMSVPNGACSILMTEKGGNLLGTWTIGGLVPVFPLAAFNSASPLVPIPAAGVFWGK